MKSSSIAIKVSPSVLPQVSLTLHRARQVYAIWKQRAITRRQLLKLSQRELDDIGVTRAEAMLEAGKPFWKE